MLLKLHYGNFSKARSSHSSLISRLACDPTCRCSPRHRFVVEINEAYQLVSE